MEDNAETEIPPRLDSGGPGRSQLIEKALEAQILGQLVERLVVRRELQYRTSLRSDGYTPNFLKNESNAVQMLPPAFRRFCICARCAASRTLCTAGRSSPIKIAMMAMTTSSSMSVNATARPSAS